MYADLPTWDKSFELTWYTEYKKHDITRYRSNSIAVQLHHRWQVTRKGLADCKVVMYSHAANIARRPQSHISKTVCGRALIYMGEWTGASWRERNCSNFEDQSWFKPVVTNWVCKWIEFVLANHRTRNAHVIVAMRCRDPTCQSDFFVRVSRLKTFIWIYCYIVLIVSMVVSAIAVFRLRDGILSSSLLC